MKADPVVLGLCAFIYFMCLYGAFTIVDVTRQLLAITVPSMKLVVAGVAAAIIIYFLVLMVFTSRYLVQEFRA